jgi:hypothetical protein
MHELGFYSVSYHERFTMLRSLYTVPVSSLSSQALYLALSTPSVCRTAEQTFLRQATIAMKAPALYNDPLFLVDHTFLSPDERVSLAYQRARLVLQFYGPCNQRRPLRAIEAEGSSPQI